MRKSAGISWSSFAVTDAGKVRKINEDAYADCPDIGLWAVADGMGGHDAGDFASRTIVEALAQVKKCSKLKKFVDKVEDCLVDVNGQLVDEANRRKNVAKIGSTAVVLVTAQNHCACLWAGDSRLYRLRGDKLRSISQDHSEVEEMVAHGLLLRENAEDHPAANVITRAVGAAANLYVDVELEELHGGDRYLLCSDGLYREVAENEICEALKQGSCEDVCNELLELALERGSRDNVTIVVIDFRQ